MRYLSGYELPAAVSAAVIGALLIVGFVVTRATDEDPVQPDDRFARLASRPLELPRHLASGDECLLDVGVIPIPGVSGEGGLGPLAAREARVLPVLRKGPVYAVVGGIPRLMGLRPTRGNRWPTYEETLWISKPRYRGPVLVRGGRLDRRSRIRFGSGPQPGLELRLPAGEWDAPATARFSQRPVRLPEGWRVAVRPTQVKAKVGTNGCFAFQVDGEGFSYVLPFLGVVQEPT